MPVPASRAMLAFMLFCCLVSFAWAMRNFFRKPERITRGMKLTALSGIAAAGWNFWAIASAVRLSPPVVFGGCLLYLGSLGLFWWAVSASRTDPPPACFSQIEPRRLLTNGPYRFVRHPFYCSYMLAWIAGPIATKNGWLGLTLVLMGATYAAAGIEEEKALTSGPLACQYIEYRARTGRFLPIPWIRTPDARQRIHS